MTSLAVVPILVTGGAAILPAILAAVAGFIALLFKPRELWRACKRYPGRLAGVVGGLIALGLLIPWVMSLFEPGGGENRRPDRLAASEAVSGTDWSAVALEILARQQRGAVVPVTLEMPPVVEAEGGQALMFRRNSSRLGGDGPSPVKLREVWSYRVGNAMWLSSPLVRNGRVYAAYTLLDPPRSFGGVVCLDASTGREIWMTETLDRAGQQDMQGFFSSPALTADGKNLLIGQGLHYDKDAPLICLDAETGEVRWVVPTTLHVESSPAIDGDIVVVGAGAIEDSKTRRPIGHPGYVFAVRISTGEEVWRFDIADPESSPAIADGVAFIGSGFNGKEVVALRIDPASSERLVWRTSVPHPATGPVTVAGDTVLIGVGNGDFVFADPNPEGFVIAMDRATGRELWRSRQPDAVLGPVAVKEGRVVVPVRNGELVMLRLEDGQEVWRARLSQSPVLAGPAVLKGLIYVTSADGYLHVVEPEDGSVAEKILLNDPARPGELGLTMSSPWVTGGRVYVGSETGGLRAFDGAEYR
ncbi:MAG: PQQ-binding-like beta-propeller repeat protein [Verrucomicrobiia bacterium]